MPQISSTTRAAVTLHPKLAHTHFEGLSTKLSRCKSEHYRADPYGGDVAAAQPGGLLHLLALADHRLLPLAPTLGSLKREIGFRRGECEQFGSFEEE